MIPKIKDGSKPQTTRIPRKPRKNGDSPYKVGEKVQLYYRSRQEKSCRNCLIWDGCKHREWACGKVIGTFEEELQWRSRIKGSGSQPCELWSNFFGESEIIEILHYWDAPYVENGNEIWMGYTISGMSEEDREAYAKADGFDSWLQACLFFSRSTKDPMWMFKNLDVVIWDKKPIIKRWQQK